MKNTLLAVTIATLTANVCYADKINSYQDAVKALTRGDKLTLVVNFDKCTIDNNHNGKLTGISVLRLPEVTIIRNDQISARVVIPTGDVPELPEFGDVYQTSSWTFDKKNHFSAVLRVQDPVSYADKIPPTNIACDLGTGVSVYS